MCLRQALECIAIDACARVNSLPSYYTDRRHTFVFGGYAYRVPWIALVSNYESLETSEISVTARPEFAVFFKCPSNKGTVATIATGTLDSLKLSSLRAIRDEYRKGKSPQGIKNRCVKAIKDVEYRRRSKGLKGASGTSVVWAILNPGGGCEAGVDVPGGTSVNELPDMITSRFQTKEAYIQAGDASAQFASRFNKATGQGLIVERLCRKCGTPVPDGYRKCGGCGMDAPS